ncbi:hypothetical protein RSSM_05820 [Rhodopirellula sallentina SM41]|uniref:Uncharacterized protein n=1 Tax=Rhodopirellula sallentina SM41 TaxID=1263870 RepID=M5TUL6_9BACT|nr:hypothetical protein RSSM_05820 [Rhodopirellula sallentina SM41]
MLTLVSAFAFEYLPSRPSLRFGEKVDDCFAAMVGQSESLQT